MSELQDDSFLISLLARKACFACADRGLRFSGCQMFSLPLRTTTSKRTLRSTGLTPVRFPSFLHARRELVMVKSPLNLPAANGQYNFTAAAGRICALPGTVTVGKVVALVSIGRAVCFGLATRLFHHVRTIACVALRWH